MGSTAAASKVGALGTVGQHHSYPGAPGASAGFPTASFPSTPPLLTSINGLPPHSSATTTLQNGTSGCTGISGGGSSSWPPEGSQLTAPAAINTQDDDRFEAKWAALETKPAPQVTENKAPAANPFSSNLQKTFEIEL